MLHGNNLQAKVNVKLFLRLIKHHSITYLESGGTAPRILNLGTRWSGQIDVPFALPLWKSTWYSFDRRLGGTQSWSGHCGQERNIPASAGIL